MPDTWGALALNVMEYQRPAPEVNVREKPLLPDPTNSGPQSVIWGTGRLRKRREISAWATKVDFDALENDYILLNKRAVTFADTFTMNAVIESLQGERKIGTNYVFYSATFVEV